MPGIAAVILAPHLSRPDEAYPKLMTLLPSGLLGLVFVALIAAIIASMGSKINSIATIFTIDVFKAVNKDTSERTLVIVGRFTAIVALIIAMVDGQAAAWQFRSGLPVHPGIHGLLYARHRGDLPARHVLEARDRSRRPGRGRGSPVHFRHTTAEFLPAFPFMNRMGYVFLICLGLAIMVSLAAKAQAESSTIDVTDIDYSTSKVFDLSSVVIVAILAALYATWW